MKLSKDMMQTDPICECDHVLSDHRLVDNEGGECLISGCDCAEFYPFEE